MCVEVGVLWLISCIISMFGVGMFSEVMFVLQLLVIGLGVLFSGSVLLVVIVVFLGLMILVWVVYWLLLVFLNFSIMCWGCCVIGIGSVVMLIVQWLVSGDMVGVVVVIGVGLVCNVMVVRYVMNIFFMDFFFWVGRVDLLLWCGCCVQLCMVVLMWVILILCMVIIVLKVCLVIVGFLLVMVLLSMCGVICQDSFYLLWYQLQVFFLLLLLMMVFYRWLVLVWLLVVIWNEKVLLCWNVGLLLRLMQGMLVIVKFIVSMLFCLLDGKFVGVWWIVVIVLFEKVWVQKVVVFRVVLLNYRQIVLCVIMVVIWEELCLCYGG